jgi:hypothetical protein
LAKCRRLFWEGWGGGTFCWNADGCQQEWGRGQKLQKFADVLNGWSLSWFGLFCCFSKQDGFSKMFDHMLIYLSFTFVLILGFILSLILSLTFFLILGLKLGFVFGLALLLIFGFTLFFILSVVLGLTLFFINSVVLGLTLLLIFSFVLGFTLFLVLCGTLLLKYDKKN